MARVNNTFFATIEKFHNDNLYLPTRTIYFAGTDSFCTDSDEVSPTTIGQLIKNLHILTVKDNDPITLLLNTCGGEWESGIAVYDMIKKLKCKIYIIGLGKLYSMGSILFQAGAKRLVYPNTFLMMHDGTSGYSGGAKSFENWAKHSEKIRNTMYHIYYERMKQKKSSITLKEIEEMCSHDTILSSKEMVKLGLADKII